MTTLAIDIRDAEPFPIKVVQGVFHLNLSAVERLTLCSDGRVCIHWKAGGAMIVEESWQSLLAAVWRRTIPAAYRPNRLRRGLTGVVRHEIGAVVAA